MAPALLKIYLETEPPVPAHDAKFDEDDCSYYFYRPLRPRYSGRYLKSGIPDIRQIILSLKFIPQSQANCLIIPNVEQVIIKILLHCNVFFSAWKFVMPAGMLQVKEYQRDRMTAGYDELILISLRKSGVEIHLARLKHTN